MTNSDGLEQILGGLRANEWQTREGAAKAASQLNLSELTREARSLLISELTSTFSTDWDWDTRRACLDAIVHLRADPETLTDVLSAAIQDQSALVRDRAAMLLADIESPTPKLNQAALKQLAREENDSLVERLRDYLMAGSDSSTDTLTFAMTLLASDTSTKAAAGARILPVERLSPSTSEVAKSQVWEWLRTANDVASLDVFGLALVRIYEPALDELVDEVLAQPDLETESRSRFLLRILYENELAETWHTKHESLIDVIKYSLLAIDPGERVVACEVIDKRHRELSPRSVKAAVASMIEGFERYHDAGLLTTACKIGDVEYIQARIEGIDSDTRAAYVRASIDDHAVFNALFGNASEAGRLLLDVIRAERQPPIAEAIDWVVANIDQLPVELCQGWYEWLDALVDVKGTLSEAINSSIQALRIRLHERVRANEAEPLLKVLRSGDEGARRETVPRLLQLDTLDAIGGLVREWGRWILLQESPWLVDLVADRFRQSPMAVLPLLDLLNTGLSVDEDVTNSAASAVVPADVSDAVDQLLNSRRNSSEGGDRQSADDEVNSWLSRVANNDEMGDSLASPVREARNSSWGATKRTAVREVIEVLTRDELEVRRQHLQRRVAKQLAEMSDQRFFRSDISEAFSKVRQELLMHAVGPMGQRLLDEIDLEVREWLARSLGHLCGSESPEGVEALARAIVGEERTRAGRRDLLARYYLEPSKEHSEQAGRLLSGAVKQAKRTLVLLQTLNSIFFLVALTGFGLGLYMVITSAGEALRIAGGAVSAISLLSFLAQISREPLQQIQASMGRLVQLETAFASFVWELNLNGTYIQSKYVAEGKLSNESIAATVTRIEDAMTLAMDLVDAHSNADSDERARGPRLTALVPSVGEAGGPITAYGIGLRPRTLRRKDSSWHIAIDHSIVDPAELHWGHGYVRFTGALDNSRNDRSHWISVIVDGLESNALPFVLGASTNGGVGAASTS